MRPSVTEHGSSANRIAWWIGGTYLVLGALWILLSDRALEALVRDPAMLIRIGMLKGWAFVLVSAVCMAVLVRRHVRRVEQAEEAQAAALRTYGRLVESSPLAIIVLDEEGIVESWNPAAERLLGWSASEVVGRPYPAVPDDQQESFRAMRNTVQGGQPVVHLRVERITKSGKRLHVLTSACDITRRHAGKRASVAFLVDVTEKEAIEEQLRQSQKLEAVGRLAGGVAHDFNNLLTIVNSYSALLADDSSLSADARQSANQIADAGRRAASLTKQLLAFSRRQALRVEELDLNDVVRSAVALLERLVGDTIVIATELAPSTLMVRADRHELEQAVMQLVVNAREAMPQGGTVRIETLLARLDGVGSRQGAERGASCARLVIRDTGAGMDAATKARLFEPFFTTKGRARAAGLGLASVYGSVTQSGGTIDVESSVGSGTTFILNFPLVDAPRVDGERATTGAARAPEDDTRAGATILVAEDDDSIRGLAARVLRRAGYTVIVASDGEDLLKQLDQTTAETRPELLLTDVVMPKMDGRRLAERVRARYPKITVVYMSGYSADETLRSEALEAGGGYLPKPFTPSGLLEAVGGALN
jgi:PAS domain S-box-containing protein